MYGSRRLQVALLRAGISVGRPRTPHWPTRKLGLCAIRPSATPAMHPEHKIYPYLLRDRAIAQSNQVWATDIT